MKQVTTGQGVVAAAAALVAMFAWGALLCAIGTYLWPIWLHALVVSMRDFNPFLQAFLVVCVIVYFVFAIWSIGLAGLSAGNAALWLCERCGCRKAAPPNCADALYWKG